MKRIIGSSKVFAFFILSSYLSLAECMFPTLDEVVKRIELLSNTVRRNEEDPLFGFPKFGDVDPGVHMTTLEIIRKEGYPAEAHVVLTDDGYLLTMHRIPGPPGSPTVFLQHGLLASSFDWVLTGKDRALAFMLHDQGYDVWMGNARGNTYSKCHIEYSTSDVRFWNFSWQEMATYDLPAEISYITNMKKENITYIGHSMGTTMFYAMAIEKPEIASKVTAMFSLAPVAFVGHLKSPIRLLVPFINELEFISKYIGEGQFLPQNILLRFLARYGCDIDVTEEKICANVLFVICGFDASQFNYTLLPRVLSHTPAGASTKTVIHFGQEVKSGRFQKYDYGSNGNMALYNTTSPPDYDLSKVQVPIGIFWAANDWLASPKDVATLYDSLPKKIFIHKVEYPKFNHLDFMLAVDAPKLVYTPLIAAMKKYQ